MIAIIKSIETRRRGKQDEPKLYGRGIVNMDGEITDELIYRDICETLKNAGVLQVKRNRNSATWIIKAVKWEGH